MLVALCATAFFVPRMLEKGSAELYFHKPIARWVLLLSRYFAGLLFVALVAAVLATGMYLGLRFVSDHDDPGILVAALMLTYKFVPIYAFTVLAGVVMRSTVGSLLVSGFFFLFNGCIQTAWITIETTRSGPSLFEMSRDAPAEDGTPPQDVVADEEEPADDDDESGVSAVLFRILDVLHLVLPKTADSDYLGQKLRRALAEPLYHDPGSLISVARLPDGFRGIEEPELAALAPSESLRPLLGSPVLGARAERVTSSLWSRPATSVEKSFGERVRRRSETSSQAAKLLEDELERAGAAEVTRENASFGSGVGPGQISGQRVTWRADGREHAALVLKGAGDDTVITLLSASTAELTQEAPEPELERYAYVIDID
jgi:hypothetical protein